MIGQLFACFQLRGESVLREWVNTERKISREGRLTLERGKEASEQEMNNNDSS